MGFDADVEKDANRELVEEIGASGTRMVGLGDVYPDTGLSNSRVALFYAEVEPYGEPEGNEAITRILPTSTAEFERKIADGEIADVSCSRLMPEPRQESCSRASRFKC